MCVCACICDLQRLTCCLSALYTCSLNQLLGNKCEFTLLPGIHKKYLESIFCITGILQHRKIATLALRIPSTIRSPSEYEFHKAFSWKRQKYFNLSFFFPSDNNEKFVNFKKHSRINNPKHTNLYYYIYPKYQGPVVQSIISWTSSLVITMLTVLVSTISNWQIFLLKKCE